MTTTLLQQRIDNSLAKQVKYINEGFRTMKMQTLKEFVFYTLGLNIDKIDKRSKQSYIDLIVEYHKDGYYNMNTLKSHDFRSITFYYTRKNLVTNTSVLPHFFYRL